MESSDSILRGVPRLVVGTERLGSVVPGIVDKSAFRHLDALVEAGCTAFDVAASYQVGGTERLLGAWLRSRRDRDRLFLIGKGGHPYPIVRPNRLTPRALERDLEGSLRRLGTDRFDLYLVHRDNADARLEDVADALGRFLRQGKIRAYGVSNWHHSRIAALDRLVRDRGLPGLTATSPQFSLVQWSRPEWPGTLSIGDDPEARAFHAERGLTVLAWSPLGRGFLTGGSGDAYQSPANVARRGRLEELARKRGATTAQIALAWLFSQPFPVHAIAWSRSVAHMKENLAAADMRLEKSDRDWLETGT